MKHTLTLELELVKETHKSPETRVKMLKQAIERKARARSVPDQLSIKLNNPWTNQYLSRKPIKSSQSGLPRLKGIEIWPILSVKIFFLEKKKKISTLSFTGVGIAWLLNKSAYFASRAVTLA